MEIVVAGRHVEIPDRFREFATGKLTKVAQYDSQAQLVQVEVVHENNPRQAETAETVEITVRGKGPVIRAEASAADMFSAFDVAMGKLMQQERRAKDRRKSKHKMTRRQAQSFDQSLFARDPGPTDAPADLAPPKPAPVAVAEVVDEDDQPAKKPATPPVKESTLADSPVVIREKVHQAKPMNVEEAIYEMELVGHPFFLFVDSESGLPSVLYHRHGWTYGVLRLETSSSS
ncbi:MAG: ribosome-associated translation inhibitor RaiA [Bifidobacteriaceae bacterium]|jgi:ribosomal subunit interface protein|nr:ribosome-associated translation inhibitor RaiA [Bifidobacteriaceae bacterium]